jgi:heme/copper-type cytochrome/quinol oxidase subunit 2
MPAFVKTPRFIISTIFLIWLISVIWENHNEPPVYVFYAPLLSVQLRLVWALVSAAIFGAVVALVIQFMWTHRASRNASSSVAA